MKFTELSIKGAWLLDIEPSTDERGFFARTFCTDVFARHGLENGITQCSISFNNKKGTLRGMHYQVAPHEETKLVRCSRGAVYDVVVDIRKASATFGTWLGFTLSEDNNRALYIPAGCAHGFMTTVDKSEVYYQISEPFHPDCARGFRYNDGFFSISWPLPVSVISPRDQAYEDFAP
jgi:dTDP-4-dehydrorhamnose 3,5-epimerase